MSNGTGKESSLTKVDTVSGSDYVRVIKSGASRSITVDNFATVIDGLIVGTTLNVVTSTINYLATTANDVVLMDVTAATRTATLPAASSATGKVIQIKKIDGGTNDVTIATVSGNIDGSATATLSGSGGAKPGASLISDGSNWYILNA